MTEPSQEIPLSQRIAPIAPIMPDGKPRSKVYNEAKLNGDYSMFMEGQEGFNPDKPLPEKQRDLFALLEKGEVEDPVQAWEWALARKWDEWDEQDKKVVWENLTEEQKNNLGQVRRIFGQ